MIQNLDQVGHMLFIFYMNFSKVLPVVESWQSLQNPWFFFFNKALVCRFQSSPHSYSVKHLILYALGKYIKL